jgi:hypothetical protein
VNKTKALSDPLIAGALAEAPAVEERKPDAVPVPPGEYRVPTTGRSEARGYNPGIPDAVKGVMSRGRWLKEVARWVPYLDARQRRKKAVRGKIASPSISRFLRYVEREINALYGSGVGYIEAATRLIPSYRSYCEQSAPKKWKVTK